MAIPQALPKFSLALDFTGFKPILALGKLNGTNGFRLDGMRAGDNTGNSVSSAGDVNGDGVDDLIIGARLADPNGQVSAGSSYVVFGKASGFRASVDLSRLNGTNGFRLDGVTSTDFSGSSVSSAGDVNGDGFDDLIIGAFLADPNGQVSAGSSYVVFGKASSFDAKLRLRNLDGANGFRLDGVSEFDFSGSSVSSAGDVNNDGFDDLIIGAYSADPNGKSFAGSSYVVFGKASDFGAKLRLSSLDGTNGFRLDGLTSTDFSGVSVSSAGDINDDGFDDLIIGASSADPNGKSFAGSSYVVFGNASGFGASVDLSSLDGNNGFRLDGVTNGDNSGSSVSSAGDVNGDGFDDLIIGARDADPNAKNGAGSSYVVFGNASGFSASLNLSSLDGTNGFRLDGVTKGDNSGSSVSSAGDVNGDGFDDLIIGSRGGSSSYVVFGKALGFGASLNLGNLGSSGFRLDSETSDNFFDSSVSSAGDVNGDGVDDLIIGSRGANSSYVVFGKALKGITTRSITEGESSIVTVYRSNGTDGDVTATLIAGGTARTDNYTLTVDGAPVTLDANNQFTLTIPDGEDRIELSVSTIDDSLDKADKTLSFSIVESPNIYELGDSLGTLTITDNDRVPGISISGLKIAEGDKGTKTATFAVQLSEASQKTVSVNYKTLNGEAKAGSDYDATRGTLTFSPGETREKVTVPIRGDKTYEKQEAFFIRLSDVVNGKVITTEGKGVIQNDDPLPKLTVADTVVTKGDRTSTSNAQRIDPLVSVQTAIAPEPDALIDLKLSGRVQAELYQPQLEIESTRFVQRINSTNDSNSVFGSDLLLSTSLGQGDSALMGAMAALL